MPARLRNSPAVQEPERSLSSPLPLLPDVSHLEVPAKTQGTPSGEHPEHEPSPCTLIYCDMFQRWKMASRRSMKIPRGMCG